MDTHSSTTPINTTNLSEEAQKKYTIIAQAIRKNGHPNPKFPKDKDVEYHKLRDALEGKLEGLGTILKNMKQKNIIDYSDPFIKDATLITLVEDYFAAAVPLHITYEQITEKVKGDQGGHVKTNY